MSTLQRWSFFYISLLLVLVALGRINQQKHMSFASMTQTEVQLEKELADLSEVRYRLMSPLALRKWAEDNGFVPMSLARWEGVARP